MTPAMGQEQPGRRPRSPLPLGLRLPAAAGLLVFAVAVGTTHVALLATNREADRQFQQLGRVYLDGLAASVRAGLEARDPDYIAQRFRRAFEEQHGVAERALFAYGPDGRLLARHGDPAVSEPEHALLTGQGWRMDPDRRLAWTARSVEGEAGPAGRIVAALDIAPILAARERLSWAIIGMDLLLAGLFALLAWFVLHRLGRPLRLLVRALSEGASRPPPRLPEELLAKADPRTAQVLQAYNRMADGVRERERLAAELADREQAAALGQLAAGVAHEVRNPLAGLATAVSTMRRFGDRPAEREEALAFLERGINALERIVSRTLSLYRPEQDHPLTRTDLEDLRLLARPAAERQGVALSFGLDLPEGQLGTGAGGVRQVLLNLLLNACAATPRGGVVGLAAWIEGGELLCEITDQGPGLDRAAAERLAGGGKAPEASSRRLGLGVVVGLLGDLDARASVATRPGGGTAIRLAIPLNRSNPA